MEDFVLYAVGLNTGTVTNAGPYLQVAAIVLLASLAFNVLLVAYRVAK